MERWKVGPHEQIDVHRGTCGGDKRPYTWEVSPSVYGRGLILHGSLHESVFLVVAPPAVPLPTPPEWQAPLASNGWRAAWLTPYEDGTLVLDEQEPFRLERISLSDAVGIILEHCPHYLEWAAEEVRTRAVTTAFALKPDRNGRLPAGAARREASLLAMLADAEQMLANHAERLSTVQGCPLNEQWLEQVRTTVAPFVDEALVAGAHVPQNSAR
jgi:hypothetical protein